MTAIFVYGTLKRGELRASCWPHAPERVEPATTEGILKDLGPYPALIPGTGTVLGELWHLRDEHVARTLEVLDDIECYGKEDVDLYVRRLVRCIAEDGSEYSAYAYFLANPQEAADAPVVPTDSQGRMIWRGVGMR